MENRARAHERFWSQVAIDNAGCWLWKGKVGGNGYGRFTLDGCRMNASRAAYLLTSGPISDGLEVCHSCDTTICVRPTHMFLATHRENLYDSIKKGRFGCNRRLLDEEWAVILVRAERGEPLRSLAKEYEITHTAIIKQRQSGAVAAAMRQEGWLQPLKAKASGEVLVRTGTENRPVASRQIGPTN